MGRQAVRECLTGPIPSIRTPFHRDGSIDFDSLRNIIDAVLAAGAKTVLLTAGDSHFECLSDEEIAEVTRVTCEQTAKRAMIVAADRYYDTGRAIRFADYAREQGADVLMCLPPDWVGSCTSNTLVEHYATVAEHLPVMIVTGRFIARGHDFGLHTVDMALDRSREIVAIKDDISGEFARKLALLAHPRCAVFAGGQKQRHMDMWPYGCDGYMSTFINFKPEVTRAYWAAIEANDLGAASEVIRNIDMPYFDVVSKLPGGFDAGIHATYELFGVAERWRRPPYYSLSDEEMEQLGEFFRQRGLL
jgi:4-hydroxy-tetrahydrodipicolinate synthase